MLFYLQTPASVRTLFTHGMRIRSRPTGYPTHPVLPYEDVCGLEETNKQTYISGRRTYCAYLVLLNRNILFNAACTIMAW